MTTSTLLPNDLSELRAKAWVGDAILALHAREWILREFGKVSAKKFSNLTSNKFLTTLGNPTKVEAEIGLIYERDGLDAARAHIDAFIIPQFQIQERNRLKR